MSYRDEIKVMKAMKLRPNPTSLLHRYLSRRTTLHDDVFAYLDGDYCIFVLTVRAGGRPPILDYFGWRVLLGSVEPPKRMYKRDAMDYYISCDPVRFNTGRTGELWHDWARRYHHDYIRPLVMDRQWDAKRYRHRSVLFHYWHVYDLAPFPSTFVNHYLTDGKGCKKPLKRLR